MKTPLRVYVGWDSREVIAYEVAEFSLRRRASVPVQVIPLRLHELGHVLTRPIERLENGKLWCPISKAPMATEFAISRFAVPFLEQKRSEPRAVGEFSVFERPGWALFIDCDMLFQADVAELFALADDRYAVMVVKHDQPPGPLTKMDGQVQTYYRRKNWSSVVLWNCAHEANRRLTLEALNSLPGRDLHAFSWLKDEEIGTLPREWNVLVDAVPPKLLHYTLGGPWFPGYEDCDRASEWKLERRRQYLEERR